MYLVDLQKVFDRVRRTINIATPRGSKLNHRFNRRHLHRNHTELKVMGKFEIKSRQ